MNIRSDLVSLVPPSVPSVLGGAAAMTGAQLLPRVAISEIPAGQPCDWQLVPDLQSLRHGAWRLARGDRSIVLTGAERALVDCLLRYARQRMACDADTLTRAVLDVWRDSGRKRRRTTANLPVTIGRLRKRARAAGLDLQVRFDTVAEGWCWDL